MKRLDREDDELFESPTVERWELRIRRVLAGEKEYDVVRVGSAAEHVSILIAESTDTTLAKTYFTIALRNIVQEWHPHVIANSDLHLFHMLDLIMTFTPIGGLAKVKQLLDDMDETGRRVSGIKEILLQQYSSRPINLYMKALQTIRAYV